jgi:uncharacterized delta-60 repeat protein
MRRARPTDKPHVERLEDRTLLSAPGDLDLTFGAGGVVTTPIGTGTDTAHAVAIDSSGRIVTAGYSNVAANQNIPSHLNIAMVRYTASGTLDSSFDGDGKVTTEFNSSKKSRNNDVANAIAIQPDGRMIVAGYTCNLGSCDYPNNNKDFALVRYNLNGSLDTSFGTGGKVRTAVSTGYDEIFGIAIQPDGKIVAAGGSGGNFALVRYNVNGSLDTTFSGTGKVFTDFGAGEVSHAVRIQSDGMIVAAGRTVNSSIGNGDFALTRYNSDGSLDGSFGTGGKLTTDFGGPYGCAPVGDGAYGLMVDTAGKIIAAGNACQQRLDVAGQQRNQFGLARYNPDGTLDATFGTGGKVITPLTPDSLGADELAYGIAIDSSGKIIAAGKSTVTGGDYAFGLVRYNVDGSLDSGFGSSGVVITDIGSGPNDTARGVAVQPDDKIVVAGHCADSSGYSDVCVARYLDGGAAIAAQTAARNSRSASVDLVIDRFYSNDREDRDESSLPSHLSWRSLAELLRTRSRR